MRVLIKAEIPIEVGNQRIIDGALPEIMASIGESLRPEAAYFALNNGNRTAYYVVNMNDSSEMPKILEPFYFALNAKIEVLPVMNQEDLAKGMDGLQQSVEKYGKYNRK